MQGDYGKCKSRLKGTRKRCKNAAIDESGYCQIHHPDYQKNKKVNPDAPRCAYIKSVNGVPTQCKRPPMKGKRYCNSHLHAENPIDVDKETKKAEKRREKAKKEKKKYAKARVLTSGDTSASNIKRLYSHMPANVRAMYDELVNQSPDKLKPIISEVAIVKAVLQNYRLITMDMPCTVKRCSGHYACDTCGLPMKTDNSAEFVDLVDKVTRIVERFSKIEDSQRIYVEYVSEVIELYMKKLRTVMERYVTNPTDFARLSQEISKLGSGFSDYAHARLGLEPGETGGVQESLRVH